MARTEAEQLVFTVEARINALEKQMARAGRVTDTAFGGMERRAKQAAQTMEKEIGAGVARVNGLLSSFGKGLVAGLTVGGISGIVSQLGQVARGVATIGDEAKRAGVSAQAFQEWKFVAEQNRIGIDQMTDGLKELNLRADEFATTGKGSAAEAFARLGYNATDVATKLKDPSAMMLEIIGRLGQMDKAAQIRIADELFGGTAGERFVELLDQGEAGIRKTIDRAHELGAVMSDELIAKAAEVDRRFNEISITVGNRLKSAIVSAADSLSEFIDGFRAFENQQNRSLRNRVSDIDRARLDLENQILDVRRKQSEETGIYAEHERRMLEGQISVLEDRRRALTEDSARIEKILAERSTQVMERNASREWTPPAVTPQAPASSSGGGGYRGSSSASRDQSARSVEREADAVRRLIAELEQELQLVGATDLERETANALRQAGAAATEQQKAKIVSLVAALHAEEEATRNASEAASELREIGRDVLGGFISDLREGTKAADALDNALNKIADRLMNSALDGLFGGGSGGGWLSQLFGGGGSWLGSLFLAKGGAVHAAGGGKIRGAGGPKADKIPAMLSDGEFVVNARATRAFGPMLEAINSMKLPGLPAFNIGGVVSSGIGNINASVASLANQSKVARGSMREMVDTKTIGQSRDTGGSDVRVWIDQNGNLQAMVDKRARAVAGPMVRQGMQQANAAVVPTVARYQSDIAGGDYRG